MIELDAQKMGSRKSAHEYLREMLSFPEYYGGNLDALHDELTARSLRVRFISTQGAPDYFQKVLRVFRAAAKQNPDLQILE